MFTLASVAALHWHGWIDSTGVGYIVDLGRCKHAISLDLGSMVATITNQDSCHDTNYGPAYLQLTPIAEGPTSIAGKFALTQGTQGFHGAAGDFYMLASASGGWVLDLRGFRN